MKDLLSSVQSLSQVRLFATSWTAARQASLSITNSRSPPKPMSIESVMPSSHLILCWPLPLLPSIFPASGCFAVSQLFASGGQSIGVSASASVLPMNIQHYLWYITSRFSICCLVICLSVCLFICCHSTTRGIPLPCCQLPDLTPVFLTPSPPLYLPPPFRLFSCHLDLEHNSLILPFS